MPILEIDGIGRVEVGADFLKLPPDRQAAEVDAIAAQIKPQAAPIAPAPAPAVAKASAAPAPGGEELKARGAILPVGVTQEGKLTPALPGFLEGPRQTIVDMLSGKKTVEDLTGEEIFNLGALFAGVSSAGGTGAGIARSSAERTAAKTAAETPVAEGAAVPAAEAVAPAAVAAPAVAPVAAPVAAEAVAPAAARGGLHSTPETLALRGEAKAGFKALDDSNIVVNPKSFKPVTQEIFSDAALKGLDETITPSSVAVIKRLNAVADEPITLQSLNTLREVAGGAAGSKVAKDAMIAERIIDKLDDFMGSLKSKDLMLGSEADATAVAQAVNAARKTWAEMSKLEVVSRLVQRAQDSVAQRPQLGLENVLRNEFTALAKNERQMAKFTPEERNAVRQITRGATKAFMRGLGRGAPRGSVSAFTSGGIGGTISTAMGLGPIPGAVAAFGIGEAGRKLATVLTQRSVKNLENVIKSGRNEMAERAIERGRSLGEQLRGSLGTAATAKAATDRREKR